jgi:hypothetical protein
MEPSQIIIIFSHAGKYMNVVVQSDAYKITNLRILPVGLKAWTNEALKIGNTAN